MPDEVATTVIERKVALLVGYTDELAAVLGEDPSKVHGNVGRRAVERLVQLLVEVAVDINGLLIDAAGLPPPATSRESFESARRAGAISKQSCTRYVASYVGLRNRIVHDYERIDNSLVAHAAGRLVGDARSYAPDTRTHASRESATAEGRQRVDTSCSSTLSVLKECLRGHTD